MFDILMNYKILIIKTVLEIIKVISHCQILILIQNINYNICTIELEYHIIILIYKYKDSLYIVYIINIAYILLHAYYTSLYTSYTCSSSNIYYLSKFDFILYFHQQF